MLIGNDNLGKILPMPIDTKQVIYSMMRVGKQKLELRDFQNLGVLS